MTGNNKLKISARVKPQNYDLIRGLADVAFRDEGEVEGNMSASLDFLLDLIRMNSKYAPELYYMTLRARFLRGERSTEVFEGMRRFETLTFMSKNNT